MTAAIIATILQKIDQLLICCNLRCRQYIRATTVCEAMHLQDKAKWKLLRQAHVNKDYQAYGLEILFLNLPAFLWIRQHWQYQLGSSVYSSPKIPCAQEAVAKESP